MTVIVALVLLCSLSDVEIKLACLLQYIVDKAGNHCIFNLHPSQIHSSRGVEGFASTHRQQHK